ncbi:MAG: AMP-dependent synthetase and ligase [Gemmatimonadetes bacterium]|nr:AMP-dependent synthetase and ligase [Gemmatimonadota bacterium]
MTLTDLFKPSLIGRANRAGLELTGADGNTTTLTFGEIDARANRLAAELAARGLARGDRLCVHLPNRVEFLDLFLACTRLGVIFVPANVLYRERELRHIVADAEPRAVVSSRGADAVYPPDTPVWLVEELSAAAASRSAAPPATTLTGTDPALIVYTSGTTGVAKGAVLTHDNLAANARTLTEAWRITEADRYLAVLPLFHVHGLANGIHCWLLSGCLMRLEERFDQRSALRTFLDFRPSLFFGVPTVYVRLLDPAVIPDEHAAEIGRAARLFVSGSAPLPAHVHAAFIDKFGHTILERYGMSEALMIMSNPYDGERRAGTVGPPLPGVSARLVGDDGSVVGDGDVGEIEIRSPHLYKEYWRRADATAAADHDGWFRTGDVAVRSDDGYYTLRGRRGDLIISGGFNIYPREIEELLLEDSRVHEAAVTGMPDDIRGEVPVAYIVAEESLDVAELEALCRSQLASFKVPRAFRRIDVLPRTALGKVQKHLLPTT